MISDTGERLMFPYDERREPKKFGGNWYFLRAVFKTKSKAMYWAKSLKRWGFRYRIFTLDALQHILYSHITDDLDEHYYNYGVWVYRGNKDSS